MDIKYKILQVNPQERIIEVRYYTDIVTESDLATEWDEDSSITRCRTDYSITLYDDPAPVGTALEDLIASYAPVAWFTLMESSIGEENPHPDVAAISALIDSETTKVVENAPFDLEIAQKVKKNAIDKRTQWLISRGFTFEALAFSLSSNAQSNWAFIEALKGSLVYPFSISTLDGGSYALADAAEASSFVFEAFDTINFWVDSGRALKDLVDASTDQTSLEAVSDDRN